MDYGYYITQAPQPTHMNVYDNTIAALMVQKMERNPKYEDEWRDPYEYAHRAVILPEPSVKISSP